MNGFLQEIRGLTTWRGSSKQIRMADALKLRERQKNYSSRSSKENKSLKFQLGPKQTGKNHFIK